jgi:replication initiation protein RepC
MNRDTIHGTNPHACGTRRLTIPMLAARDRADGFKGLPAGSAKPFQLLAAFQEAEPYLGLPAQAGKWIAKLVKLTRPVDWEEGSRPMAWPTARQQEEFLGLSSAAVKAFNRAMGEAGIYVMRDDAQGRRHGHRDSETGRITEAYGFDLSPLALRYEEFKRIAAEARAERKAMGRLRSRATIARRAIGQVREALAALGALHPDWPRIEREVAELLAAKRRAKWSGDLAPIVEGLEALRCEAEQWLRDTAPPPSEPAETSPTGPADEPHITDTNQSLDFLKTVNAAEGGNPVQPEPPAQVSRETEAKTKPPLNTLKTLGTTADELLDLAPRLAQYVPPGAVTWGHALDAADWLRGELGVSRVLWGEACQSMGRDRAVLALAIVSTKAQGHFTRSAGGYFAGMVRRHASGELHLERSLWALRNAQWGRRGGKVGFH